MTPAWASSATPTPATNTPPRWPPSAVSVFPCKSSEMNVDARFDSLWESILDVGREPATGGYRRFAWNAADLTLREWFTGEAERRAMTVEEDRNGNTWAWWMPTGCVR